VVTKELGVHLVDGSEISEISEEHGGLHDGVAAGVDAVEDGVEVLEALDGLLLLLLLTQQRKKHVLESADTA